MKCLASNKSLLDDVKAKERECAIRVIVTTVATTAFDKCGLCKKTVEKLLLGAINQADSINKGYIKFDDLTQMLKDDYDFEIKFTGGD